VLTLQRMYPEIHVALLLISGVVGFEEEVRNPANIAEELWKLYSQEKKEWAVEVTM